MPRKRKKQENGWVAAFTSGKCQDGLGEKVTLSRDQEDKGGWGGHPGERAQRNRLDGF